MLKFTESIKLWGFSPDITPLKSHKLDPGIVPL